jgi:hypothetical protein
MFTREVALKLIVDGLAQVAASCETGGSLHLLDNNTLAHHFYCRLLNEMYGLKLDVMDRIVSNYPAIDLGDVDKHIAYQITRDKTSAKVSRTLNTFMKRGLQARFHKLKVLVIGKKQRSYEALKIPTGLAFNPEEDIVDHTNLVRAADGLPTPCLERLAKIVDEELEPLRQRGSRSDKQSVRVTTHTIGGVPETVDLTTCKRCGKPVVPPWLHTDPTRMGSPWLVRRLSEDAELRLYYDPNWGEKGTYFVVDLADGDGVVLNCHQWGELKPSSATTTTTPAPVSGQGKWGNEC